MSRKKRTSYLIALSAIFIILLPLIIFYAIGYRLGNVSWFDVLSTGGIFVRAERSGVEVSVDGTVEKKTGIFQHSFLIPNLKPGVHDLLVKADGYTDWVKKVEVFPEKVTEINPVLIPGHLTLRALAQYVLPDGTPVTATSTAELKKITDKTINPDYTMILGLFNASSTPVIATSSRELFASANFDFADKKGLILKNKLVLWQDGNNLKVQWLGDDNGIPYYFCSNEVCQSQKEILVNNQIKHFDYYMGKDNYVLAALPDGLYVYEIDDRTSPQNKALLVVGNGLDFRISPTGALYVKNGKTISIADL